MTEQNRQRATRQSYLRGHTNEKPLDHPRTDDRNEEIDEPAAPDPTDKDQPSDDDPEAD